MEIEKLKLWWKQFKCDHIGSRVETSGGVSKLFQDMINDKLTVELALDQLKTLKTKNHCLDCGKDWYS